MHGTITVKSEVPFGRTLYTWLYINGLHIDQQVSHDYMEKSYLAWETVRKHSNPYFETGTGFEGYFVGRCSVAEAALDSILTINQNILDAIARLYRMDYGFRSRLMKTLTREASDRRAIHIWSAYLGAELGRLRAQILLEPEAQEFQRQTYKIISMLPPMSFEEADRVVRQTYAVGTLPTPQLPKLVVTAHVLKPNQQDAWLVAENIGVFGHPLVRKLLDREVG
ncbi:MAG: hypothetical protein IT319_12735 [Anaerolineae bacterium]|nr:hypothetical protein [Anaerolineae bacterium]